jgi:hypothetical protein
MSLGERASPSTGLGVALRRASFPSHDVAKVKKADAVMQEKDASGSMACT